MQKAYNYTLVRTSRKTIGLTVKDGEVIVRGPKWLTRSQADAFVYQHADWIDRQVKKQEKERAARGRQRKLTEVELTELKKQAKDVIPARAQMYAGKIGVHYNRISIRAQHTRWGSCSAKGNLNFNCLLLLMPKEAMDSVIVHELCHLKEMNHSARFYALVRKAYPNYDKWNKWIKKNGGQYLSLLPD